MANEKVSEKDFEESILIIKNMIEAQTIERFKFTDTETGALDFAIRTLQATLDEIKS
jgi:hypothetical protein